MRISAFREVYSKPGLYVMECAWVNVPMDTIFKQEIVSNSLLEMPGIHWRRNCVGNDSDRELIPAPIRFQVNGDEFNLHEGMVFYRSISELVEFIAEKVDFESEGPLSELASRARTIDGKVERFVIEDILDHEERRRKSRYFTERPKSLPLQKLYYDNMKSDFHQVSCGNERVFALRLNMFIPDHIVFAFEEFREINGYKAPRFVLTKPLIEHHNGAYVEYAGVLTFDGDKYEWCRHMDDLPPALLSDLDERGSMYYLCDFDILPIEHLESFAIVRVPPRDEVKRLVKATGGRIEQEAPPHPLLANPALAFDSHYPIPIPDGIEVVDSPEAALWFLSRTVKGIFIPGQAGRMFPVSRIPERESFQLLTRPRRFSP